jgi:hypothetical protein
MSDPKHFDHGLEDKAASENEVVRQIYKQITPTFDPGDDDI